MTDYTMLAAQLIELTRGEPLPLPNLANASALMMDRLSGLNWAGFYLIMGDQLVLGPFQGKPACIRIPVGKGVCGTAALQKKTVRVQNVHDFPGHIACDSASNSEIVVPLIVKGEVVCVLDIDSPLVARFDERDQEGLEALARILEKTCDWDYMPAAPMKK